MDHYTQALSSPWFEEILSTMKLVNAYHRGTK